MARFMKLFLLFCLNDLLFDYEEATCSSPSPLPSPSSSPSSPSLDDLLCNHSEKTALLQFKSLFGENPRALITWKDETSSDCCSSWYGVTCDELTGHVIKLDLSNRQLHGAIPSNSTLFHLSYLQYLDLSDNDFNGSTISFGLNFSQLRELDLSSSNIAGSINWLTNLTELQYLDLSSNKLTGPMPTNISSLQKMTLLILRNNSLSGTLPHDLFDTSNNLKFFDLSHNSFQGPLPQLPPSTMNAFLISHNKLEGEIPLSYCDLSMLAILVLSHNNLSGVIPECITNSSPQLLVLDLGMNGFHGTIPNNFPKQNTVTSINLKGNRLGGKLPSSLANCRNLRVLDVGNNKINDTYPYWLQSLPELQVLVLRHNKFHGSMGLARTKEMVTPFPKLRIFDLSHNKFVGPLPSNYFHRLSAMRNMDPTRISWLYMGFSVYDDTIEITLKGVDYELPRILKIFAAIDLSDNNFEGEIPKDIGSLRGIQSFNLSSNALAGKIPSTLANLTLLESLDLSSNQLYGVIPQELTRLSFLKMLNLSSNLLTGEIPRGTQFNTFKNDSYGGNSGLCGPPLSKKCFDENGTPSPGEQEEDDEDFFHAFTWKTVLLEYGCGTTLGLGVGFVIFKTGRPKRLVTFVEDELLYMITKRPRRRPAIVFLSRHTGGGG